MEEQTTLEAELVEALKTLDVPLLRKDVSKIDNLRWLQRNVIIRNNQNVFCGKCIELIKKLLKYHN